MIRKLRWKFVLTNMLMVTLILCGIAALVVSATRSSLRRNSLSVLYQASREGYSLTWPDVYRDSSAINLPYFSVMVGTDGSVVLLDNHFGAVEDTEQLRAIVQSCVDQEAQLGVLPDYRLRYLKQDRLLGCRIVFVDASQEWSTMASLLRLLGLIFAGTLVAFFLLSLFLARWATKPVEESWLAQRQFVSDASHELKTPLAVITANVDLLDRYGSQREEKEQRWLENIRASSGEMSELVEELLTLARSDNQSKKDLVHGTVDWSELVEESVLLFEAPLLEADRPLEDHIAPGITVSGDPAKLRRLTEILLDNARKYAQPHTTVTLRLEREGGKRARLSVNTKGKPIPPEQRERIFERLYRSDQARSSEGFGLGLAIAQAVAREHKGKLWLESAKDTGNTFSFSLPVV
jgi:signal transduction histidine kinase